MSPAKAAQLFTQSKREDNRRGEDLYLKLDLRTSLAERTRAVIQFYKKSRVEWARPLTCRLEGKGLSYSNTCTVWIVIEFLVFTRLLSMQVTWQLVRVSRDTFSELWWRCCKAVLFWMTAVRCKFLAQKFALDWDPFSSNSCIIIWRFSAVSASPTKSWDNNYIGLLQV